MQMSDVRLYAGAPGLSLRRFLVVVVGFLQSVPAVALRVRVGGTDQVYILLRDEAQGRGVAPLRGGGGGGGVGAGLQAVVLHLG